MPLALGPGATGDKLAAAQDAGTDVVYEINGDLRTISGSIDAYGSLAQGALSTTATALVGPSAGTDAIIDSISVFNTGASTRVVTFFKTRNSTTYDATTRWAILTLLAGEHAEWIGGQGWLIYTAQGIVKAIHSPGAGMSVRNSSVAATAAGFASDTYLVGSALALPTGLITAKTMLRWRFDAVKTAAGTAAPAIIIRFGVNGSTADTARNTFTFTAQTAAVDRAIFEIFANFNAVGASGIIAGVASLHHQLAVTGFNITQPAGLQTLYVASGTFDTTVANSIVGLSVNGGASAAWTINAVQAEAALF